ncbi:signal transduction histidine kinase [Chitinophaga skermanii]|uniref:histidine kinase n=1 Tax=Chitinophaga skermanii TaxID=331697 RepID=A0A327QLF5_9BACT|nr:HAMP domain-containing sensor histidine kinase [Chitinophaga skermanii]RAJ05151.1 signal transduction histidine kinase [Chitinophaga skermanii]
MLNRAANYLSSKIKEYWQRLVNVGVTPNMPFIEARRTKLLNLLTLPCIPCMFFFAVLNFIQERYLLSAINIVTTLTCVTVYYLHTRRLYLSARLVLILLSIAVYTFTGIFFHNGSEYFILNILFVTILIYDNKWMLLVLSVLTILAFCAIVFFPQHWEYADPVPQERVWTNVAVALSFIVIGLSFFKYIQNDYQSEVEHQRQTLLAMNKDKEKLFSIVAHDIRSPLATLEVLLDMFAKGEYPEEEMNDAALVLHKKVQQLGTTLDNLLRWSTRSMKGIQTNPTQFIILPLTTETMQFFGPSIAQKDLNVEIKVPPNLSVYADKDQVSVIIRNLFSNALKFSYPGGKITMMAKSTPNGVCISISDEGTGMSPEQLKSLFSFQHQPGFGTVGERGTGLGLMLCMEFAQGNGGTLDVSSTPENGTTFTLTLPAFQNMHPAQAN